MKVLVLGAAGKTGILVVKRALAAGHTVTALIHAHEDDKESKPEKELQSMNVELIHGDVRNPSRLDQIMPGQDAVIDAIGGDKPFLETDLESSAARVLIDVMLRNHVKRLIVISVLGAGDSKQQAGFFYEHLLMPVFLRGAVPDKERMEQEVETSGLDFVIVRPPMLSDADPTGIIYIVTQNEKATKITRADLAQFLVDQLTSNQYLGQAVTIENR
jgi:putative NADH-flavin reductase